MGDRGGFWASGAGVIILAAVAAYLIVGWFVLSVMLTDFRHLELTDRFEVDSGYFWRLMPIWPVVFLLDRYYRKSNEQKNLLALLPRRSSAWIR